MSSENSQALANSLGYGPNLYASYPAEEHEPLYTPATEIILGDDGNVEYRQNIPRPDGTYVKSPSPSSAHTSISSW